MVMQESNWNQRVRPTVCNYRKLFR